ncbi:hypothetical protein SDC9_207994 [bioreactor metagenome]|uniref:Uncharacterized protein n=1 Tax=bioreactor metagenome TaxID=1076179 RepID=A0A645J9C8_9ZZZZ
MLGRMADLLALDSAAGSVDRVPAPQSRRLDGFSPEQPDPRVHGQNADPRLPVVKIAELGGHGRS